MIESTKQKELIMTLAALNVLFAIILAIIVGVGIGILIGVLFRDIV